MKTIIKKLSIREIAYIEDLKNAAKKNFSEKLKLALELSDFCRYLQSRSLMVRGNNDRTKTDSH